MNAYGSLLLGYMAALCVIAVILRVAPRFWHHRKQVNTQALGVPQLACMILGILALGQVYQHGLMLQETSTARDLARAMNQLIIFAPALVIAGIAIRKGNDASIERAMLPSTRMPARLAIGAVASASALLAYAGARTDSAPILILISRLIAPGNLAHAAQILGEDICIGLCLATSLRYASRRMAVLGTGTVFALAHVPSMLAGGAAGAEFAHLIGDALLACLVLSLAVRMRDMWVFWPVHVGMDLMQFYGGK